MAKLTLTDIAAGYALITTINANNALIEAALENTVSLDGTTPNALTAALDVNSKAINNCLDATAQQSPVTLAQLTAATVVASSIAASLASLADAGGNYAATTVEAAFAELASVSNAEGASIIGFEDAGGDFTAVQVEAALTELAAVYPSLADPTATLTAEGLNEVATQAEVNTGTDAIRTVSPATLIGADFLNRVERTQTTANETRTSDTSQAIIAAAGYSAPTLEVGTWYRATFKAQFHQNVGNLGIKFVLDQTAQLSRAGRAWAQDVSQAEEIFTSSTMHGTGVNFTNLTDNDIFTLVMEFEFQTHATVATTCDVHWAQQESSANATTLYAGATLELTKLD